MGLHTNRNIFSLLLLLPIILLYANHFFNHDPSSKPTGWITAEHATYMVYAKQYKTGEASVFFRYPFQVDAHSPKIFFQPQTFILGYLWKWTNLPPAIILTIFGLVFAFLSIRTAHDIIQLVSKGHARLLTLLFIWGGGLLVFAGAILHLAITGSWHNWSSDLFRLDPGGGWWCLYFGRALIYPLEAFFHFLFLFTILSILRKKFLLAGILVFILTLSHSYTSAELSFIILIWLFLEKFYLKSEVGSTGGVALLISACCFTFLYYLVLSFMPVYREIFRMVALNWGYKAWNFVPAYAIVWGLTAYAIRTPSLFRLAVANSSQRLFLVWGLAAFVLSVHDFAIKPVQPLHFTRGYVYAGFFLFGMINSPELLDRLNLRKWLTGIIVFFFCLDNIAWFASQYQPDKVGAYISKEDEELLHFMGEQKGRQLVYNRIEHADIALFIQLNTDHVSWLPHPYLTLDAEAAGSKPEPEILKSKNMPVMLLLPAGDTLSNAYPVLFRNGEYVVRSVEK